MNYLASFSLLINKLNPYEEINFSQPHVFSIVYFIGFFNCFEQEFIGFDKGLTSPKNSILKLWGGRMICFIM